MYNSTFKKANNSIKKLAEGLNRHSPKKTQVTNRHTERCLASLTIREMQIKITSYHVTPVRMAIIKKKYASNKSWRRCGEKGTL